MTLYHLLKPLLFSLEPEKAHHLTMKLSGIGFAIPGLKDILSSTFQPKELPREVMGLRFPNPIGLAAGFDKDGKYLHILEKLGFGFIEVGTVTPRPQPGNPQPRLFRLKKDQALINRMGFNNEGLEALRTRLDKLGERKFVLGGNIGKNKDTSNEDAALDYMKCFHGLYESVDYFVVNVSSPNTPGLRALQEKEPLKRLLTEIQNANQSKSTPKPILLKVAPDLTEGQIDDIVQIVEEAQLTGLVATNTTTERSGLQTSKKALEEIGAGGLSGAPVYTKSTEILSLFRNKLHKGITIIGVGGILSPADAVAKVNQGADLVQIYTGLIYSGPELIRKSVEAIRENVESIAQ